ncbi:hypothetical protein THAR02_07984 [Trichoderma harzianum]|uniref:Cyanovirin-N domain-containing protein n=1 Tax=Trichoderma harzianum TaxID=5544 RepID=A0A0F9XH76_TRIHA|nr:hypothetical protein THAR02_07984 [Trichoderma harzianum]
MKGLLSILALAVAATEACLTISGSCQSGSIDPYVSINANDNNQASGHTSCSNFAHCDMQISGAVNSAWVENCQYLHWNTGHGVPSAMNSAIKIQDTDGTFNVTVKDRFTPA